jgi:hypothetical protein
MTTRLPLSHPDPALPTTPPPPPISHSIVPIHEKGAIELRLLERIECPTDAKWQGRRFDLICKSIEPDAKYPGLTILDGQEERIVKTTKYKFRAPTAQVRAVPAFELAILRAIDHSKGPEGLGSAGRGEC